jgi:hypothetical protein
MFRTLQISFVSSKKFSAINFARSGSPGKSTVSAKALAGALM